MNRQLALGTQHLAYGCLKASVSLAIFTSPQRLHPTIGKQPCRAPMALTLKGQVLSALGAASLARIAVSQ